MMKLRSNTKLILVVAGMMTVVIIVCYLAFVPLPLQAVYARVEGAGSKYHELTVVTLKEHSVIPFYIDGKEEKLQLIWIDYRTRIDALLRVNFANPYLAKSDEFTDR